MDIETRWAQENARQENSEPLAGKDLQVIVSSRVKKEFKAAAEFVWASLVYQIILYSFLTYTVVRNWGNLQIMGPCLAGVALYIPSTVALIRKTGRLFDPFQESSTATPSILNNIETHYIRLADFFRFKKRMDWIGVPISCAIIVLVTFTLFVPGGVKEYPLAAIALFALWLGMSLATIRSENKRQFAVPLHRLENIIRELKKPTAVEG